MERLHFVSLDLAWGERKPTGVAVLDDGSRLVYAGAATDDDSIRAAGSYVRGDCVVGVDAPLIVTNPTGRQPARTPTQRRLRPVSRPVRIPPTPVAQSSPASRAAP